jgi:hypothetical protein
LRVAEHLAQIVNTLDLAFSFAFDVCAAAQLLRLASVQNGAHVLGKDSGVGDFGGLVVRQTDCQDGFVVAWVARCCCSVVVSLGDEAGFSLSVAFLTKELY